MRIHLAMLLLVAPLAMGGCPETEDPCSTVRVPGLEIRPINDLNGSPISGADLVLKDGTYTEKMQETVIAGRYLGAWERNGNYLLVANKQGYTTAQHRYTVRSTHCHVITISEELRMQPKSSTSDGGSVHD